MLALGVATRSRWDCKGPRVSVSESGRDGRIKGGGCSGGSEAGGYKPWGAGAAGIGGGTRVPVARGCGDRGPRPELWSGSRPREPSETGTGLVPASGIPGEAAGEEGAARTNRPRRRAKVTSRVGREGTSAWPSRCVTRG